MKSGFFTHNSAHFSPPYSFSIGFEKRWVWNANVRFYSSVESSRIKHFVSREKGRSFPKNSGYCSFGAFGEFFRLKLSWRSPSSFFLIIVLMPITLLTVFEEVIFYDSSTGCISKHKNMPHKFIDAAFLRSAKKPVLRNRWCSKSLKMSSLHTIFHPFPQKPNTSCHTASLTYRNHGKNEAVT